MDITYCDNCKCKVMATSSGNCPSCGTACLPLNPEEIDAREARAAAEIQEQTQKTAAQMEKQRRRRRRLIAVCLVFLGVLLAGIRVTSGPRIRPNGTAETAFSMADLIEKEGAEHPWVKKFQKDYGTLNGRVHLILTRGIAYRFDFIFSDGVGRFILVGADFPYRVITWYGLVLSVRYEECEAISDPYNEFRYHLVGRRSGRILAEKVTVDIMGIKWFTR